jgi:glycosyltransferase involved in cell wall biosynthesis
MMDRAPRIAIVSDALVQRGGAERVVEAMARAFPDAPIYALLYSPETGPKSLEGRVISSPLARIPGAAQRHRLLLPLYPAAIESFDLSKFDLILSSHHTVAKGVLNCAESVHVCYCHTPMRALWERTHEELATLPAAMRPFAAAMFARLRMWDSATVPRVDAFIANSRTTQRRIHKHYAREAAVVYPPIDIERFRPGGASVGDYYLVASRLVPYKRVDIAVDAARLAGRRLIVVGEGPGKAELAARGAETLGHVSDEELVELMRGARALLFPQHEDFGMTPVEMMACGRPVIAYGRGGAAETVIDGETGVLVDEQTPEAFAAAIERLESMDISAETCRRHAESFSEARFRDELRNAVWSAYAGAGRTVNAAPLQRLAHA